MGRNAIGIQWAEVRRVAKHPMMCKTTTVSLCTEEGERKREGEGEGEGEECEEERKEGEEEKGEG